MRPKRKLNMEEEREYEWQAYLKVADLFMGDPSDHNRHWLVARMRRLNVIDQRLIDIKEITIAMREGARAVERRRKQQMMYLKRG